MLAALVPQRDQAPQVHGDVVGLVLVRAKSVRSRASSAAAARVVPRSGDATVRARPVRPSRRPCTRVTCRRAREGRDGTTLG